MVRIIILIASALLSAEPAFIQHPAILKGSDAWTLSFSVSESTDVEVSLFDTSTKKTVRHLAAGKLGSKAPAPLSSNSLSQTLNWDLKDDYGATVTNVANVTVRVRGGISVVPEKVVGADPYSFFSREMEQGNHNIWTIAGIEGKPDGSVYVYGSAGQMGPLTIRKYDSEGNYIKTVFPFPSGMETSKVSGYGINVKSDGTYAPKITTNFSSWPTYTNTPINRMGGFGPQPLLIPNRDSSKLMISGVNNFRLFTLNTDGSVDADTNKQYHGYLVNSPQLPSTLAIGLSTNRVLGPLFICSTPDSASFYLSGICRTDSIFWREGQIWKVDTLTKTAKRWFALPSSLSTNPDAGTHDSYTAIHGVAVDDSHHVFVCDRVENKLLILDSNANIIRSITVANPDAVEYDKETGKLYVTTRFGMQGSAGDVKLLRFNNWRTDITPSLSIKLCILDMEILPRDRTYTLIRGSASSKRIWVAFKDIPVRIFKENGDSLQVTKDFSTTGQSLKFLGFNKMMVDPQTENIFIASGAHEIFKLTDWNNPIFRKCSLDVVAPSAIRTSADSRQIWAADLALDIRNRYLLARVHPNYGFVYRFSLDGHYHSLVPVGTTGSAKVSDTVVSNEYPGCRYMDRGIATLPDGATLSLSGYSGGNGYTNVKMFHHPVDTTAGPKPRFKLWDAGTMSGGIKSDLAGNIYVGARLSAPTLFPVGYATDWAYGRCIGKIYRFAPTGSLAQGNLYPTQPVGPVKTYDVEYGSISNDGQQIGFSPRFGVDPYGRIYFPNSLTQTVSIIDNEGNKLLSFGTYGNIDDLKKMENNMQNATSIPLSWPASVDATDDYIYVADFANVGLIRLKKRFILDNLPFSSVSSNQAAASKAVAKLSFQPNPFSISGKVHFELPAAEYCRISIIDINGKVIATLADSRLSMGTHLISWNGRDKANRLTAAGIYLIRLETQSRILDKRIVHIN